MVFEAKEGLEQHLTLREALFETTFKHGRIYSGPDVIDLGNFQPEVEELIDYSVAHPNNHEAGKIIYVTDDKKMLINRNLVEGQEKQVVLKEIYDVYIDGSGKIVQNRYKSSDFHSHPVDLPQSPQDFLTLLYGDREIDRNASSLLVTPVRKLLVFRGKETPHMESEEAQQLVASLTESQLSKLREVCRTGLSKAEEVRIKEQIGWDLVKYMVEKYDFQIFEGAVWDRYLYRMETEDIKP